MIICPQFKEQGLGTGTFFFQNYITNNTSNLVFLLSVWIVLSLGIDHLSTFFFIK